MNRPTEVSSFLEKHELGAFSKAFHSYGVNFIQDLKEFDDEELLKEFQLDALSVQRIRKATKDLGDVDPSCFLGAAAEDEAIESIQTRQSLTDASPLTDACGLAVLPGGNSMEKSSEFLFVNAGLSKFWPAFVKMGVTQVESFSGHPLFKDGDDDVLKQIGMSAKEIASFQNLIALQLRAPIANSRNNELEGRGGGAARKKCSSSIIQKQLQLEQLQRELAYSSDAQPQQSLQHLQQAPPLSPLPPPPMSTGTTEEMRLRRNGLSASEQTKATEAVEKVLSGLLVSPERGRGFVQRAAAESSDQLRTFSWLKDIAALLPQTTAGGRSSSLDASALGMHRLVEKLYSKLNECDKLRERRLRYNDRRLMGFEPELVGALRIFTAMPLKLLADAPYLFTLGVGGRIHALEVESCTISVVLTHLFLLSILPAPPSVLDASRFRYCCRIPTPGST
jgi:hypothetical protein